jgi:3-deoxy-7-phosphoheptulonate synthase
MSSTILKSPISSAQAVITPQELMAKQPLTPYTFNIVNTARHHIVNILHGNDDRLLVIVGPCSIHDPEAALDYAERLKSAAEKYSDDLCIIMRVYFEKPRTTIGWKGLIRDPWLDGRIDINYGLTLARQLLIDINQLGLPAGTEFLDMIIPSYLSDLIAWGAIGARTVESQTHRELASNMPMPIGFKNNTEGNIQVAIDAVNVAQYSHPLLSLTPTGTLATTYTRGNQHCHIILRGSHTTQNYSAKQIQKAAALLQNAELPPYLMVDCSHGNSKKNYLNQSHVIDALVEQIKIRVSAICGIMLESNLAAGRQDFKTKQALVYGQSITDGCIGWEETQTLLEELAMAKKISKASTSADHSAV